VKEMARVFVIEEEQMKEDIIKVLDKEIDFYEKQYYVSYIGFYLDTVKRLQKIKYLLLESANF
jgi:hypothetical protein